MTDLEHKVKKLLEKDVTELGYILYDLEYVKEHKNHFLRIYIDSNKKPISLDDCEKVSNKVSDLLDTADYIKDQYFLEVSSSGERKELNRRNESNEINRQ